MPGHAAPAIGRSHIDILEVATISGGPCGLMKHKVRDTHHAVQSRFCNKPDHLIACTETRECHRRYLCVDVSAIKLAIGLPQDAPRRAIIFNQATYGGALQLHKQPHYSFEATRARCELTTGTILGNSLPVEHEPLALRCNGASDLSTYLELTGPGSLQHRLARALEAAIRSKRLPSGARLPSSRVLSREYGVARNTASLAVDDLVARGLAHAVPRRGVFVNPIASTVGTTRAPSGTTRAVALSRRAQALLVSVDLQQAPNAFRHELDYGQPLVSSSLLHAWRLAVQNAATRLAPDYPPLTGLAALRQSIAVMLAKRRGITVDADSIVVVAGAQQAFDLIASVLIDPGTRVGIEDPGYEGARLAYIGAGAELHACGVDDQGMQVHQLPLNGAQVVHVTPSHQFPTGVLLSTERRHELLAYADRHASLIIEDDYDSELRFGSVPAPSLYALADRQSVIYVGTFSKMLFPAMRLGYMVIPHSLLPPFTAAKLVADRGSSVLEQAAVADMLASGAVDRHLRKLGRDLERRRCALTDAVEKHALGRIEIRGINAGMHVVARICDIPWSRFDELQSLAGSMGLHLVAVRPQMLEAQGDIVVLLGFSAAAPAAISDAVRCLCVALDKFVKQEV